MLQLNFLETAAQAEGKTYERNQVLAYTGGMPPVCIDQSTDLWICPYCEQDGMFHGGLRHIRNLARCDRCGDVAVFKYTLQHDGWRKIVDEETLVRQAVDPVAAWKEATKHLQRWNTCGKYMEVECPE